MKTVFVYLRFFPILLFYPLYKDNKRLCEDVERWISPMNNQSYLKSLATLLYNYREFRNLFIFRNRYPNAHRLFCLWIKIWYPPENTLFIECPDIEGGLYIQHGFATYISAQRIGKNFSVNQQVTIGHNGTGQSPIIGDNCMVMCGAKVLGDITIGNNTRIGANTVVIRDYKRGYGVLVGVPAVPKNESSKERLKQLGIEFDETLFN